jgi:hypothetical protein
MNYPSIKGVIEVGAGTQLKKRLLEIVQSKSLAYEDEKSNMLRS